MKMSLPHWKPLRFARLVEMAAPIDLSIVIVNWNTAGLLCDCLRALYAAPSRRTFETIIVDNASSDESVTRVRREFPQAQIIQNTQNLGFARGNNQGLRASQGHYVLLLNSDTQASSSALEALLDFMDHHPEAGACGPRLLKPEGGIQPFAFGEDPTPGYLLRRAFNRLLFQRPLHDWNTDRVQVVGFIAGTCLLVRRTAIQQAGLLDEGFFMYFEDNDWCRRFREHGWKIYYCPQAAILHVGGQSIARNPQAREAYYHSLRYFYARHYRWPARLWLWLALPWYRQVVRY